MSWRMTSRNWKEHSNESLEVEEGSYPTEDRNEAPASEEVMLRSDSTRSGESDRIKLSELCGLERLKGAGESYFFLPPCSMLLATRNEAWLLANSCSCGNGRRPEPSSVNRNLPIVRANSLLCALCASVVQSFLFRVLRPMPFNWSFCPLTFISHLDFGLWIFFRVLGLPSLPT